MPDGWAFDDDPCGRMIAGTIASTLLMLKVAIFIGLRLSPHARP